MEDHSSTRFPSLLHPNPIIYHHQEPFSPDPPPSRLAPPPHCLKSTTAPFSPIINYLTNTKFMTYGEPRSISDRVREGCAEPALPGTTGQLCEGL